MACECQEAREEAERAVKRPVNGCTVLGLGIEGPRAYTYGPYSAYLPTCLPAYTPSMNTCACVPTDMHTDIWTACMRANLCFGFGVSRTGPLLRVCPFSTQTSDCRNPKRAKLPGRNKSLNPKHQTPEVWNQTTTWFAAPWGLKHSVLRCKTLICKPVTHEGYARGHTKFQAATMRCGGRAPGARSSSAFVRSKV